MTTATERGRQDNKRLLAATEWLLLRDGVAGVTSRSITAEAELSIAMVNYHFGSRGALLAAVLQRRLQELNLRRVRRLEA